MASISRTGPARSSSARAWVALDRRVISVTGPGQEVEIALPGRFNISPRLMQAMKVVPGVADVAEL